jgi:hypothetical protein
MYLRLRGEIRGRGYWKSSTFETRGRDLGFKLIKKGEEYYRRLQSQK